MSIPSTKTETYTDLVQATRQKLVEHGRKFVSLLGVCHRFHRGVAYMKNDDETIRLNCNSRIMVDPVTFRRVNPNYPYSHTRRGDEDATGVDAGTGASSGSDWANLAETEGINACAPRGFIQENASGQRHSPRKPLESCRAVVGEVGRGAASVVEQNKRRCFAEEELLIASPVVLGFDLSEKCWLEFSLSGLHDIRWNENALRSVLVPDRTKQDLEALVSNHLSDAASKPANAVELKEKGLNVVLHGPSGVGKTMTGAAIAEHLKRPLYVMSADELGVSASSVAQALGEAVDNTHSWGAILLLDAADVYLEARQAHDSHHNSVVSLLLRFMERHHSVFIMTTDRVESFDGAVQGHIHMGIRLETPTAQWRRMMWRQRVGEAQQGALAADRDGKPALPLSELDLDDLSKRALDGRQIASIVQASRNRALFGGTMLARRHIDHALELASSFEDDMRGGKGYRDAMQHYT